MNKPGISLLITFLIVLFFVSSIYPQQFSLSLSKWERFKKPVFDGFIHAYNPCIIEVHNNLYPYRMWFFGWIVEDYIGRKSALFLPTQALMAVMFLRPRLKRLMINCVYTFFMRQEIKN